MSSSSLSSDIQRKVLFQSEAFEVVSIFWSKGARSALHNHGWSQCHVLVQEGLFENLLLAGAKTERQILEVGQVLSTPVGADHEVLCLSEIGQTLHIYTPKIREHFANDRKFNSKIEESLLDSLHLGSENRFDELTRVLKLVARNAITTHSPFFMNQLFSGVHPQALVAEEVIAQTKTTMATHEASSVFAQVESEVVDKLCEVIGWSAENRDGVSVPGGSAANFTALQLAKHKKFPETKKKGLANQSFQIFVSSAAHYSFQKAAVAMGFGSDAVVSVATDDLGRMNSSLLAEALRYSQQQGHRPLLVCATAGTTVLGAFDPIGEIYRVCQEHQVWLHVDAAWGGPALFSKKVRDLMAKVELADSVTFDAHKFFGASLTCSFILTRHQGLLLEANDVSGAEYLFHDGAEMDRGKMSWQCGRRADALTFWSLWKNLGTAGLGHFVDRLLSVRDESLEWIRTQDRLEIVQEPSFLNLCVRVMTPNRTLDPLWSQQVREKLKSQNLAMVNYSADKKGTFLRLILCHPQLSFDHVRQILTFALDVT